MSNILDKGPGDVKYPFGRPKNLKKNPEGIPDPLERDYHAEGGVQDDEIVDSKNNELNYTPKATDFLGDDGLG